MNKLLSKAACQEQPAGKERTMGLLVSLATVAVPLAEAASIWLVPRLLPSWARRGGMVLLVLGEIVFLISAFGEDYVRYRQRVCRYLGRKALR